MAQAMTPTPQVPVLSEQDRIALFEEHHGHDSFPLMDESDHDFIRLIEQDTLRRVSEQEPVAWPVREWDWCADCGKGLDTGWECTNCGKDWKMFAYPPPLYSTPQPAPAGAPPLASEYLSVQCAVASKDWMHGWDECRAYVARRQPPTAPAGGMEPEEIARLIERCEKARQHDCHRHWEPNDIAVNQEVIRDCRLAILRMAGERITPQPPTAAVQGWQPIETAPRDGTVILLGMPAIGALKDPNERRVYEGLWSHTQERFTSVNGFIVLDLATHWMPLPAPPNQTERKA